MNGIAPGYGDVKLDKPGTVKVSAKVAFAKDVSLGTAPAAQLRRPATRARSNWS